MEASRVLLIEDQNQQEYQDDIDNMGKPKDEMKPPCYNCKEERFDDCATSPFKTCKAWTWYVRKGSYKPFQIGRY